MGVPAAGNVPSVFREQIGMIMLVNLNFWFSEGHGIYVSQFGAIQCNSVDFQSKSHFVPIRTFHTLAHPIERILLVLEGSKRFGHVFETFWRNSVDFQKISFRAHNQTFHLFLPFNAFGWFWKLPEDLVMCLQ